jgi:hypothetical protein
MQTATQERRDAHGRVLLIVREYEPMSAYGVDPDFALSRPLGLL